MGTSDPRADGPASVRVRCSGLQKKTRMNTKPAPHMIEGIDRGLLDDLVAANHILVELGVLDGYGHVSVRHPGNPSHYLIARWMAPELVTLADLAELDLDSNSVFGDARKMYSERFIHGEIYRSRPDVNAVVHTHAPATVLFGAIGEPLRPVYHMASFIGLGVPVFDIREAEGMTDMLVSTPARGRALARTLGEMPAALMRGHGAVTVGRSLPAAVGRAYYLKINAEIQAQAAAMGASLTYLDPEEVRLAGTSHSDFPKDWEAWKHRVAFRRA